MQITTSGMRRGLEQSLARERNLIIRALRELLCK